VRSGADIVLESLRNENIKDFEKKEIEEVLGPVTGETFSRLINLPTDYGSEDKIMANFDMKRKDAEINDGVGATARERSGLDSARACWKSAGQGHIPPEGKNPPKEEAEKKREDVKKKRRETQLVHDDFLRGLEECLKTVRILCHSHVQHQGCRSY
jgi:hypothetical protein